MAPAIAAPAQSGRGTADIAAAPYREAGRFVWRFARGKSSRDRVFAGMPRRGPILEAGAAPAASIQ